MKLDNNRNKLILLGIVLLIIAGVVVVLLKGLNVPLTTQKHDQVSIVVAKPITIEEAKGICKEVFGDKKHEVKIIEIFNDTYSVEALSISEEEKNELVDKTNQKFETEIQAENVSINSVDKVRLRDMFLPYFIPLAISAVCIYVYIGFRFRDHSFGKILLSITCNIIVTEAIVLSLIAICRIPANRVTFFMMVAIALVELIVYLIYKDNKIKNSKK